MFKKIQKIHFVGIGGAGMSGIAEVLLNLGYKVSGSDMKESEVTHRLAGLGARILLGHEASHSDGAQVVVTSTAVSSDNPEVVAAKSRRVPVIPRIEMLAELARLKYTIAIAGTHGKTTTTSMVAAVLAAGNLDPTVIVGGRLKHLNSGARMGQGDYLVAEADESDGSFLKLSPTLGVITNIDNDHLDYYGTFDKICEAFVQFGNHVPFYGSIVACADDPFVRQFMPRVTRQVLTYGLDQPGVNFSAKNVRFDSERSYFDVYCSDVHMGAAQLRVPGRHNVLNALAAIGIGYQLDIPFSAIAAGLESFEGVGRRLELKGESKGFTVIDDYGHHPTEIRATLAALRDRYPKRRIVAIFQPHRYSRTQSLYREFAEAFDKADAVYLLPIYPAGEKPIPNVTSDLILEPLCRRHAKASLAPTEGAEALRSEVREGDVILTLGAGDVWKWGETLLGSTQP